MRISDWSSDVCSSDLIARATTDAAVAAPAEFQYRTARVRSDCTAGRQADLQCEGKFRRASAAMWSMPNSATCGRYRPAHILPPAPTSHAAGLEQKPFPLKSEERRVGQECFHKDNTRGSLH